MLSAVLKQDVSRETSERLEIYKNLLEKWNKKINLVSDTTIADAWVRHIIDSAQLWPLARTSATTWVDIGSGAGFPGAVIAILARELSPDLNVTMIESDQRKATFIRTVLRETQTMATVIVGRIERVSPQRADIISARALAPLDQLFDFTVMHRSENGQALFLKGENWRQEQHDTQHRWTCDLTAHKSVTDPNAAILEIGALTHV